MLRLATERHELQVINDQIGAPTGADLLADVTAQAIRSIHFSPNNASQLLGLYHVVAAGETSWFDYARFVIEWARLNGQHILVTPDAIKPTSTNDYPTPAKRPLNSRLDTSHFQHAFGIRLPHWQKGVERMLTEISGKSS